MAVPQPERLEPILRGKSFEIARLWKKAERVKEPELKGPFYKAIGKLEEDRELEALQTSREKVLANLAKDEKFYEDYKHYQNYEQPYVANPELVTKKYILNRSIQEILDKKAENAAKRDANLAEIAKRNIQTNYTIARKSRRGRGRRRANRKTRRRA